MENKVENKPTSVPLDTQLEAILFAMGQETTITRLVKIVGKPSEEVIAALDALHQYYESQARGLALVRQGDNVQLVTAARVNDAVERYQKGEIEGPLSRAALETLAIIAYRGPISKPEIDVIRGVNSGIMLRTLLVRGLVDRKKSATDARTHVYSVSLAFLRHLGVTDVKDIPGYHDAQENKILEKLEQTVEVTEQATSLDAASQAVPAEESTPMSQPDVSEPASTSPDDEAETL